MKTLMKNSLMSDDIKFKIMHSNKNFIDLDEAGSSSDSEESSHSSAHPCQENHLDHDANNALESSRALVS